MDINAEVSTQLSLIDALLSDLDKPVASCANKNNEKKEEENQDAMPDSTTHSEKPNTSTFHCGDDVLVPNKDGRYYLGTIVELSTSNDNDSCEVSIGEAQCLVKFGDGTHSWASLATLKLLSAPPADDGRIMCVVCKRREGAATGPNAAVNAIVPCDMCGRGYHAKCHTPPIDSWITGASWHCKRCVDQRYRVAAAENRALKRNDFLRFKGGQQRRQQQELTPPCDTASTTSSTNSDFGKSSSEANCYCGEKSDWLAQMLLCVRCSRWFHQRCVTSLQYPLYAGDKLYIFSCAHCNGGTEYLRRLELCWLDLAHLALYNLTAYNAPNYFDMDTVIMPYIMDNWHALQLPEMMWRTPVSERRENILTALTSSRKRFKCGREMKKRATIWGLRQRGPPPPPGQLSALEQIKKGEPLTDELIKEYAPRLKFLPPPTAGDPDNSFQTSSTKSYKSSYKGQNQRMIVPVDGHWLNLMMGKRFHENLNSNSNSENDSTSSYESVKIVTQTNQAAVASCPADTSHTKDHIVDIEKEKEPPAPSYVEPRPPPPLENRALVPCSVKLDKLPKDSREVSLTTSDVTVNTHTARIATMNLELSKMSTKNIIEHSKILSLQHMDSSHGYHNFPNELESSGDETSSKGTLDSIIPPLKDFQGKNNPFLMKNGNISRSAFAANLISKQNARTVNGKHFYPRLSLPAQLNTMMGPFVKPLKRKLSEKDIVIGPNGEVKRRKFRRPRKYLQLNKSCPLPDETSKSQLVNDNIPVPSSAMLHGRRLRQRQEKNYYESTRRSSAVANNNSVKSLQLSPHKTGGVTPEVDARQLSELKSSVQSYFRAGQTFHILAKRVTPGSVQPAYLLQWDGAGAS